MDAEKFTLRELQPADGPALTSLITEFEDDLVTHFQVDAYQAILCGTEFRTTGVAVEAPSVEGFVGMGTVRFGKAQYNGTVLPFAFLDGLKVRKAYRGKGLGFQIANWRVQRARQEFGEDCVIGTGMLHTNQASHAVASKWCRDFVESALEVKLVPMRTRRPRPLQEVQVREIEVSDYEQFASRQNAFYSQHNLYMPSSPESIRHALGIDVEGRKPYRYFAAVDRGGNLLAGAQTWARGILKSDVFQDPPLPLRLANQALHLLPPDLVIRDVSVTGFWFQPGKIEVGHYLWEMMRWLCRDQGTTLATGMDVRDPAAEAIRLKPWHQPRPKITIAVHGPTPLDRERFLSGLGRV